MIDVNGEKILLGAWDSVERTGWYSRYAIWEIQLSASVEGDEENYDLSVIVDGEEYDAIPDSGVPLDADRDEVEDFMQEAWDTFLTTYLAEIERSHQIRNPRIVCEDGAWTVVGDD